MARKVNPLSKYHIFVHTNGSYKYASTQPSVTDKKTGKKKWTRIHWGTIDENLTFHPNKKYITCDADERNKLIFPSNIDMSLARNLIQKTAHEFEYNPHTDVNKLYGDIWMLEKIAERSNLKENLLYVFDYDEEKVNEILTIAYYIVTENDSLSHLARWQNIEKVPANIELNQTVITELVKSIRKFHRTDLLKFMNPETKNLCAIGTRIIRSSLDEHYDEELENILQIIVMVIYSLKNHIPVYYDIIPSVLPSRTGLDAICEKIESGGFAGTALITDINFFSTYNILKFIKEETPAIMVANTSDIFIKEKINNIKYDDSGIPEGMKLDEDKEIYFKQYKISTRDVGASFPDDKFIYLNLYFDSNNREMYITNMESMIEYQRQELDSTIRNKKELNDETYKTEYKYFNIEFYNTSYRVRSYSINQDKVENDRMLAGYFANIEVNIKLSPMEVFGIYYLWDEQKKLFEARKRKFDIDISSCLEYDMLQGRVFILFVASVLFSHLKQNWQTSIKIDKDLIEQYPSPADVLDEMRSICYIESEGRKGYITPFTDSQLQLCRLFNIDVPE